MAIISSCPLSRHEPRRSRMPQALVLTIVMLLYAASIGAAAQNPVSASHLLPPSGLRCAGQSEPLAVADGQPRFSWQLAASLPQLHGVSQTAYQIQVAEAGAGFAAILWESGEVEGAATTNITYAGPPLNSGHAYQWRVRAWDEQRQTSDWSATAHWSQAPVWHAGWIAAPDDKDQALPLFRKSFTLSKPVAHAMLYVSGLGQDELWVNGKKVGIDELAPGWSEYRKTVYYDSYEISNLLHAGDNALGVMLGNGMYRVLKTPGRYTKFVGSRGEPKCTVQLHIEFAGGESLDMASDGTWKTHPGPITFSSTYGGEDYDARREMKGWDQAGFDDTDWHAAAVDDGPGGTLRPEAAPPVRVIHTYEPVKVTHPKPEVTVYDLE